jgi:hypothetical protein
MGVPLSGGTPRSFDEAVGVMELGNVDRHQHAVRLALVT